MPVLYLMIRVELIVLAATAARVCKYYTPPSVAEITSSCSNTSTITYAELSIT